MAKFNISRAAKLYGKDRSSIQRKIKQGKLSYDIDEKGYKVIDLSELIKEYGEPPKIDTVETHAENDNAQQLNTVAATEYLQEKISMLEERVDDLVQGRDREREEHKGREDWLKKKIDTQALLLEDKRNTSEEQQPKTIPAKVLWAFISICVVITAMPIVVWFLLDFLKQ